jgi:copper(I)-binding protein
MDVRRTISVVVLLLLATACGGEPAEQPADTMGTNGEVGQVLLRNVYLSASAEHGYDAGDDGRVRLWLFNRSSTADALVDVRSAAARSARMTWDRDCDGAFEPVDELPIRAGGTVPYDRPYAVELVDFTREVRGGTTVSVTFVFRHAGEARVDAMVEVVGDGDVGDPTSCGQARETPTAVATSQSSEPDPRR